MQLTICSNHSVRNDSTKPLEQARAKLGTPTAVTLGALVNERHSANKPTQRVLIRDGSKVHIIPVEKIDYVKQRMITLPFVARERNISNR